MPLSREDMRRITPALRAVFWGFLIYITEIRFRGYNLADNFIGMCILTWGLFSLGRAGVPDGRPTYPGMMLFVKLSALLACASSLMGSLEIPVPFPMVRMGMVTGVLGTVLFCVAMRWLCLDAGLEASSRS